VKLSIDHAIDETGKSKFLTRIMPELKKMGVECLVKDRSGDLCLHLTRFRMKFKGPRLIRVDGCHLTDDVHANWNNDRVAKCIKKADATIWQSPYCKKMGHAILKAKPRREYVIFNGANPDHYKEKIELKTDRPNIIMSANWKVKPHKRLKEMCAIAADYQKAHFWVAGRVDMKNIPTAKNITFLGHLEESTLQKYIASCDIMFNLAFIDWCPNAVVECLVAGLPVVYAAGTGLEDLVGESGVKVSDESPKAKKIRVKPKSKRHVRMRIPPINYEEAKAALDKALKMPRIHRPDLHIATIAKQYHQVFKDVLGG